MITYVTAGANGRTMVRASRSCRCNSVVAGAGAGVRLVFDGAFFFVALSVKPAMLMTMRMIGRNIRRNIRRSAFCGIRKLCISVL